MEKMLKLRNVKIITKKASYLSGICPHCSKPITLNLNLALRVNTWTHDCNNDFIIKLD